MSHEGISRSRHESRIPNEEIRVPANYAELFAKLDPAEQKEVDILVHGSFGYQPDSPVLKYLNPTALIAIRDWSRAKNFSPEKNALRGEIKTYLQEADRRYMSED